MRVTWPLKSFRTMRLHPWSYFLFWRELAFRHAFWLRHEHSTNTWWRRLARVATLQHALPVREDYSGSKRVTSRYHRKGMRRALPVPAWLRIAQSTFRCRESHKVSPETYPAPQFGQS